LYDFAGRRASAVWQRIYGIWHMYSVGKDAYNDAQNDLSNSLGTAYVIAPRCGRGMEEGGDA